MPCFWYASVAICGALVRRQVSDKRWTWLFLRARARIQDWPMIKELTLRKVSRWFE